MARWNGSTKARVFCPGRSISIVEAALTTIAIHFLRGGSQAHDLTYRNSARYWPASAIGAIPAIYAGTSRRIIGVQPADLWAKVMMAPARVQPSWVEGAEPP